MRFYEKPSQMISEIGRMRKAESLRREDRATVGSFFNGAPPMSQEQAESMGLTINVNHLFGYTEIRNLRDQLVSLWTKPARCIEISLDAAPAGKRLDWGLAAQDSVSEILKSYRPFKTDYVGVTGDAALHGESVFFFGSATFPMPKQVPLSRMLVPDGASTDVSSLTHFAIEDEIDAQYLSAAHRHDYKDWRKSAITRVLKSLYKDMLESQSDTDPENFEELEYKSQENSATPQRRNKVAVVYFFQQRVDEDGPPFDLTILLKPAGTEPGKDEGTTEDQILFERKSMFPKISSILHPFFMDCILGGAPKWHRVMGTGTLNYQLNISTEILLNRAEQATYEGAMNLWTVKDGATREEVSRILMQHNGVVPESMELLQNRFAPNLAGMIEMIQYMRMQGGKNARGPSLNGGNSSDVLEVQAIADQNRSASENNMTAGEWYDFYDALLTEKFARFTNATIDKHEPGYSMIKDFQNRMQRKGIPLYWLQPHNVRVKAVRVIGDGIRSRELEAATVLQNNRQFIPPEKQPAASRVIVALGTGDYRMAEDFFPIEQKPDTNQIKRAQTENAILQTSGEPMGREADDIDEIHAPVHFKALEGMIADAMGEQQAAFTPKQAKSFTNIGGHIHVHIQTIEGKAENNKNDHNRQLARALTDQLNQYAALGDKLVNNMQQAQQAQGGQGEPLSEEDKAKLQLSFEQLKLAREKMQFSVEKFNRTHGHREQSGAFSQMMQMEADAREKDRAAGETRAAQHAAAMKELEVATKIAQANKPQPAASK